MFRVLTFETPPLKFLGLNKSNYYILSEMITCDIRNCKDKYFNFSATHIHVL